MSAAIGSTVPGEDPRVGRPSPFTCTAHSYGLGAEWIHVTGELDLATSPELRKALLEALKVRRLVVLDLRELSFMDCSGVRTVLEADRAARREGARLLLVRGVAQVNKLLTLTGVTKQVLMLDAGALEASPQLGAAAGAASRLAASWDPRAKAEPPAA